jgi:hypothetical protein
MPFAPIEKMFARVETTRADSDASLFGDLLHLAEYLAKLLVAYLVACVQDDRDRSRYRLTYQLLRASSPGDWAMALDDIVEGPTSGFLIAAARPVQKEITQKTGPGDWQYEAVKHLINCISIAEDRAEAPPAKTELRRWFSLFARFRNKTRGHGAPTATKMSQMCGPLECSIRLLATRSSAFAGQWAFLHQNLSGKYRVTPLTSEVDGFEDLKKASPPHYPDGVYALADGVRPVELVRSDMEASDFFVANGALDEKTITTEFLSYVTGLTLRVDASGYVTPPFSLPASETAGIPDLDVLGNCFSNLPPRHPDYVPRSAPEKLLAEILLNDRHPVVTVSGQGGIGKTSLALAVLHDISSASRFAIILWFSARDIDLLPQGAKPVQPQVLTLRDMADQFASLVPKAGDGKNLDYFRESLRQHEHGPVLFVFDNFETVRNPGEAFGELDNNIRPPNKILITTRHSEFNGDYQLPLGGMEPDEFDRLLIAQAQRLGIAHLLNSAYRRELYDESGGHPYVGKILLGEVVKEKRPVKVERIMAGRGEILTALFERTYQHLSPAAKRVFLTLSKWRSFVPQVALEAVVLRSAEERFDPEAAIKELERYSFVDAETFEASGGESLRFLTVPVSASQFGQRKLVVSPFKAEVELDLELLLDLGAAQRADVRRGLEPRLTNLFRAIGRRLERGKEKIADFVPMLEYIASQYSPAWLRIADLYEERGGPDSVVHASAAVARFLEGGGTHGKAAAWLRLANLCAQRDDVKGELHAIVEMCSDDACALVEMSNAANRVNKLLAREGPKLPKDERRHMVRKLLDRMKTKESEAGAVDLSRMAWLAMQAGNEEEGKRLTAKGLSIDPNDEHCLNLAKRLGLRP